MKQLLGMAREKKDKEPPKQPGFGKGLNLNKFQQPQYQPELSED